MRLVIVTFALLMASCAGDSPDNSTAQPAATTVPVLVDRDAAMASAIDVRAAGCGPRVHFGNGTTIADNLILTAAHVVAGSEDVEAIDSTGSAVAANVVLFDPDLDFAILRSETPVGIPMQLRAEPARQDEEGIIVLTRLVAGVMETEVIDVSVLRQVNILTTDIYLDQDVERDGFEVSASIEPGDSGAMVHLPGGGVGLIWARSTDNADRAWALNTPEVLLDPLDQDSLRDAVDVGPCTG
ncbi:MAG: hypothetical protein DRJ50_09250 [Actinobacteria bacterium]|nr:MAG: hypothetical protein DRJ50_09250 [Actinomycetota bacterium]